MAAVLRFLLEVLTDVTVLPSLLIIFRRRRHFEFFMGVLQFWCSMMYNVGDALGAQLFLSPGDWHRLTNVTGLSYGVNLLVYLMRNGDEAVDHLLRYSAFALLWIAQIKDDYWMEKSQWTIFVIVLYGLFCGAKLLARGKLLWSTYNKRALKFGAGFAVGAFVFFLASLDDHADPYRWKHGVAQALFGAGLYYLWQVCPRTEPTDLLPN